MFNAAVGQWDLHATDSFGRFTGELIETPIQTLSLPLRKPTEQALDNIFASVPPQSNDPCLVHIGRRSRANMKILQVFD